MERPHIGWRKGQSNVARQAADMPALATRQVEIDLDDGVLVNYNKLGRALAHVRGLSGKA